MGCAFYINQLIKNNKDEISKLCQKGITTLRILNSLRNDKCKRNVTYNQYQYLSPAKLFNRLINQGFYEESLEYCNIINLPKESINVLIEKYCFYLLHENEDLDDKEMYMLLTQKLSHFPSISFSNIALTLRDERQMLSMLYIEMELDMENKIKCLLKLGLYKEALQHACSSSNSNYIYLCIKASKTGYLIFSK